MEQIISLLFAKKLLYIYEAKSKPICSSAGIPQTAFDILMFLHNNPEYKTARDIVEIRGIKANLVSVNVEKLVKDGYLERHQDDRDRRKITLVCTDKSAPVTEDGYSMQKKLFNDLFYGSSDHEKAEFYRMIALIEKNIGTISEGC